MIRTITAAAGLIIFAAVKYYIRSEKAKLIAGLIILFCIAVIFLYLPLYFSSLKYTATDTEIIRTSGVFIRFHQSVHYSSIQYAAVIKTFLSRYTGLNFMIFFVFGGRFRLMFLSRDDIDEILRLSGSVYGKER